MPKPTSKPSPAIKIQAPISRPEVKSQPALRQVAQPLIINVVLFSFLVLALVGSGVLYAAHQKTKAALNEQNLKFTQLREKTEEMTARIETAFKIQTENLAAGFEELKESVKKSEEKTAAEIKKIKNKLDAPEGAPQVAGPELAGFRSDI